MRFQVPQYIDVEDKIFGPLTFKQFLYLGGGVGICVVLFILLPTFIAIIASIPVAIFSAALAFFKVNEKPFIFMVEAFFNYMKNAKLYIWQKTERTAVPKTAAEREKPIEELYVPKLSDSKLKDLTWQLDIKENQNPVTGDEKQI